MFWEDYNRNLFSIERPDFCFLIEIRISILTGQTKCFEDKDKIFYERRIFNFIERRQILTFVRGKISIEMTDFVFVGELLNFCRREL